MNAEVTDAGREQETVEVTLATIAEHANYSDSGRVNVLGVLDTLSGSEFPLRVVHLVYVFRLRLPSQPLPTLHIRVTLHDRDDNVLWGLEGEFADAGAKTAAANGSDHIIHLTNIEFAEPGEYEFRIHLNHRTAHVSHLSVLAAGEGE